MKAISLWQPYIAGVLHGDGWCTAKSLGLRTKDRDFAETFASGLNATCGTAIGVISDERGYWLVRGRNVTRRFDHLRNYEPVDEAETRSTRCRRGLLMRAISLYQPWASLIAAGVKPFETRHWAPPRELIGQTIAIHAAKKIDRDAAAFAEEMMYGQHEPGGFELADKLDATMEDVPDELMGLFGRATTMPVGCIVCTATLDAAFQLGVPAEGTAVPAATVTRRLTSRPIPECFTVRYDDFGDYAPGRWAWLLTNVRVLRPPPAVTGRQGFFNLPQGWLT